MRYFLILSCLLLCTTTSIAQKTKDVEETIVIGNQPYTLGYDTEKYLNTKNFNRALNKLFGQVAVGASNGTDLANYATFEPLNGSFSLNGYGRLSKKEEAKVPVFMSLNLKAGLLNSNATELFSNSKLNTGVSGMLKFHFGLPQKGLSFFSDDQEALNKGRDAILKNGVLQLIKAKYKIGDQANAVLLAESQQKVINNKLNNNRTSLVNVLAALKMHHRLSADELSKYTDSSLKFSTAIQQLVLDSFAIIQEIKMLKIDEAIINETVAGSSESRYMQLQNGRIQRDFEKQIDTLELKAPLASATFSWITATIGLSRQKYYTYSATKPFAEQINKQILDGLELGLSFNKYWQFFDQKRIIYVNGGFSRLKNNNAALLGTTEVVDESENVEGAISRKTVRKYNAYTSPLIEFKSWLLYANGYYMFGRRDRCAIHLFPEYEVRDALEDVCNMGFGYVFSFTDKKDGKSRINLEAFFKFLDVGNAQGADNKFYNRNTIGLSVGLPFNVIL